MFAISQYPNCNYKTFDQMNNQTKPIQNNMKKQMIFS